MAFTVKESMNFLEQSINFNKNETESKVENSTQSFREKNQNIHTFTYQKILLHALSYLLLKSTKVFSVSFSVLGAYRVD